MLKYIYTIPARISNYKILVVFVCLAALHLHAAAFGGDAGIKKTISATRLTGISVVNEFQGSAASNPLVPNSTSTVSYVPDNAVSISLQNVITLSILEESHAFIPADFQATVTVSIKYGDDKGHTQRLANLNLNVDFVKGQGNKYKARDYVWFTGARYVEVHIDDVKIIGTVNNFDVHDVLQLDNEIRVSSFYTLPPDGQAQLVSESNLPVEPAVTDEHAVSWVPGANCNQTQLEWTWLEDELNIYPSDADGVVTNPDQLFRNNASRLDLPVAVTGYKIPMLYDGEGKLYYRVRAANIDARGSVSYGPWSTAQYYKFTGHNPSLNWQATTSFAEEGKRKTVVQYFDGSLRGRQTVTKDNTTNTTVVAETLYDKQGRPAIQILPAPTMNNVIAYNKNLNLLNGQALNSDPSDLFDLVPANDNGAVPALQPSAASAAYYSSQSVEPGNAVNNLLPDANGYPFSVTRYTQDGTGRIAAQSGVGDAMQINSGRQTNYYYGTPAQEELDGLFGTEAGGYTHYFKNMVKDANGQMSVSYVDMHGRTIATALTGDNPASLQALNYTDNNAYKNQGPQTIVHNLLGPDKSGNIVKGNSIESINTLFVSADDKPDPNNPPVNFHIFEYSLSAPSLALKDCNNNDICYDCLYDLAISITDESGASQPMVWHFSNVKIASDNHCANPALTYQPDKDHDDWNQAVTFPNGIITIKLPLNRGSYIVRKTLTLSEDAVQKYKPQYLAKAVCQTEQEVINNVFTTMGCPVTPNNDPCTTCISSLGSESDYAAAYFATTGISIPSFEQMASVNAMYNAAIAHCQQLCHTYDTGNPNPVSHRLEGIKQAMLADMVPYTGQYALDPAGPGVPNPNKNGTTNPYTPYGSMFNKYNVLASHAAPLAADPVSGHLPHYQWPLNPFYIIGLTSAPLSTKDFYYTSANIQDPAITPKNESPAYSKLNNTDKDAFAGDFKPSWAQSLLAYHPEYYKLQYAITNLSKSYAWSDEDFSAKVTFSDANTAQFINTPTDKDPYFLLNPADLTKMVGPNGNGGYINAAWGSQPSLWNLAYTSVVCAVYSDQTAVSQCRSANASFKTAADVFGASSALTTDELKNKAWNAFKSFYLVARESLINTYLDNHSPVNDADYLIDQGYILHFPKNFTDIGKQYGILWLHDSPEASSPSGLPDASTIPLGPSGGACLVQVPNWKNALLQCPAIANHPSKDAIINEITSRMATVCQAGVNEANPNGASTLPEGITSVHNSTYNTNDISFEQIINDVLGPTRYNIPKTELCNPYIIEYPKPYSRNPVLTQHTITQLDNCICSRYSKIMAGATAAGYNTTDLTSLNGYLQSKYNQQISQAVFDALQHCSEIGSSTTFTKCPGTPVISAPASEMTYDAFNATLGTGEIPIDRLTILYKSGVGNAGTYYFSNPDENSSYQTSNSYNQQCISRIESLSINNIDGLYFYVDNTFSNYATTYPYLATPLHAYAHNVLVCPVSCPVPIIQQTSKPYYPLPTPLAIPDFLTCGYQDDQKKCLTCADLSRYTADYKEAFSAADCKIAPITSDNLTPAQIDYNQNWARFINYRTGFNYTWQTYIKSTQGGGNIKVCKSCDELQALITAYFNALPEDQWGGSESGMLAYMQAHLSPNNAELTTAKIQEALNNCKNGWHQNISKSSRGRNAFTAPGTYDFHKENFTVEAWIKILYNDATEKPSITQYSQYRNSYSGFSLFVKNDQVYFILADGWAAQVYDNASGMREDGCAAQIRTTTRISLNHWHHVVGVRNGNLAKDYKIYVDGVLQPTEVVDYSHMNNGDIFSEYAGPSIAVNPGGPIDPLWGYVKNARMYRRMLGDAEVAANYIACDGVPTNQDNMILWAKLDEGTGTVLYDSSPTHAQGHTEEQAWLSSGQGPAVCDNCLVHDPYALCFNTTAAACNLADYTANITSPTAIAATLICPETKPLDDTTGLFYHPGYCDGNKNMSVFIGTEVYKRKVEKTLADFETNYRSQCLSAQNNESFTVTYTNKEYHYTLYYYDMAGNLVKTVPPKGVQPDFSKTFTDAVESARAAGTQKTPVHQLVTNYRYNSLNQVVAQNTPDAGTSKFWYDRLGRLVVSQNAKQAAGAASLQGSSGTPQYSYTLYDPLGRIMEVGQLGQSTAMQQSISQNEEGADGYDATITSISGWITAGKSSSGEQITTTTYDNPYGGVAGLVFSQHNLRNRVSYVQLFNTFADYDNNRFATATYYTYDIHGNVDTLVQDYGNSGYSQTQNVMNTAGNRFKRIVYDYDLISGKVNMVCYQPRLVGDNVLPADAFYHRYEYDAENRITDVYTSKDSVYWERDANYSYYKHGPLAQTVLGQQQVQGLTYAYTLQGWLKGVNLAPAKPVTTKCPPGTGNDIEMLTDAAGTDFSVQARQLVSFEPGYDNNGYTLDAFIAPHSNACVDNGFITPGTLPGGNSIIPAPEYSFTLNYYDGDYHNIDAAHPAGNAVYNGILPDGYRPLYNGNISSMQVSIAKFTGGSMLYNYKYDQLNRLVGMKAYNSTGSGYNVTDDYAEQVSYDPNGNILTYMRNGSATAGGLAMDNLTYHYPTTTQTINGIPTTVPESNKLQYIEDAVTGNTASTADIKTQNSGNYSYDEIGNLTANVKENITSITWTVYGKIAAITKTDNTVISYTYDIAGNRISKTVRPQGSNPATTWYVRDASGNVMSIYTAANNGHLTLSEVPLYGSSRLGEYKPNLGIDMVTTAPVTVALANGTGIHTAFTRGEKVYELSNHLGNVLVTIADRKTAVDANGDGGIDSYIADVVTAQDYYPFGMVMPGRQYPVDGTVKHRYGFNGKEKSDEMDGDGVDYDYGFRIYDSRVGKFLSTDPLFNSYPWYTPYQFAGNKPIWAIDLDGLEEMKVNSVANVIKDINGNIVTNPTIVNVPVSSVDMIPGVRRINARQVEVTPGLIGKPHPYFNTFTWQQVSGNDYYINQSITPIGKNVTDPIKPPKTNLEDDNDDPPGTGQDNNSDRPVVTWRTGTYTVATPIVIPTVIQKSFDLPFKPNGRSEVGIDFGDPVEADKEMSDFASKLKSAGGTSASITISTKYNKGEEVYHFKTVEDLLEGRAKTIKQILAKKGITVSSVSVEYGTRPAVNAAGSKPVTVQIGWNITTYIVKQKLINGKPSGGIIKKGPGKSKSQIGGNKPKEGVQW